MTKTKIRVRALVSALPLIFAGCALLDGGGNSTEDNIAQYEETRLALEQNRSEVLPATPVDARASAGRYLTWLDIYQGWEGVLHIRDTQTGTDIISEVPIGNEETAPFYAMSDTIAMTGYSEGMDSFYTTIDLATGSELDVVTFPKPQAAKYDAYNTYANRAYVVVEDEGKMIYEWTAGSGAPTAIGALDDLGISLGAWGFFNFAEYDGSLKMLASGSYGTYAVDLDTLATTQIPLPVMPLEGAATEFGMVTNDGFDLWYYEWGAAEVRPLHDELKNSGYEFNENFPNTHWSSVGTANIDVTMKGDVVYYKSTSGVYSYGVNSGAITPVLLDQNTYDGSDTFITYTRLTIGDAGLYVLGLESTSGATGVDGKTYLVSI